MNITFTLLTPAHFPLLLEWLNMPHVHQWWDPEVTWTLEKIAEKYSSYTHGYKLVNGVQKPIRAYIIEVDSVPVGYFQVYNAYDFPRNPPLKNLPLSAGSFDIFIGNPHYLHQGIGSQAIIAALAAPYNAFAHIIVDTHLHNKAAQRAYEKAGFTIIEIDETTHNVRLLKTL